MQRRQHFIRRVMYISWMRFVAPGFEKIIRDIYIYVLFLAPKLLDNNFILILSLSTFNVCGENYIKYHNFLETFINGFSCNYFLLMLIKLSNFFLKINF